MSHLVEPNAQQIQYWNDVVGPKWVALSDLINSQIEILGHAGMEQAAVKPGERVLDVGCGCGQTSLDLAGRVGDSGRVLAVDVSEVMLAEARERIGEIGHLEFLEADAQSYEFEEGEFDLIYSRFGVMFFAQPAAAFANLWRALRPGGRMTFVCWQEPGRNPWMSIPGGAAMQHLEAPPQPDPHAPGPFAFADAERVRELMTGAGFSNAVSRSHEADLTLGRGLDLDGVVDFLLQMGPAGSAMREAEEAVRGAIRESVTASVEPYMRDEGLVMRAAVWIVNAERAAD
ncbi:MAG: methyltransferase domain-containing protein [Myxococcota bacterium]